MDMNEVAHLLDRNQPTRSVYQTQSTGSFALDTALGGGLGIGRIVELYGDFATYKTTLAMYIAKVAQLRGYVLWLDSGEGFNVTHAKNIGLDPAKVVVIPMGSALSVTKTITALAPTFPMIVVDSAAQLDVPDGIEWLDEFDAVKAAGATVLFVNYLRIPGDNDFCDKMRHYASQRIQTIPGVGRGHSQVVVTKNQFAPPHEFPVRLRFDKLAVIDEGYEVARLADSMGLIEHGGSWLYFQNDAYHGIPGLVAEMNVSPSIMAAVKQAVQAAL